MADHVLLLTVRRIIWYRLDLHWAHCPWMPQRH